MTDTQQAAFAPFSPAFFRSAWGRIVGVLTRTFRLADPSLAEDAVQHALLQAMRTWPLAGMPSAPMAWLTAAARNHLLDSLRAGGRRADADSLTPENEPLAEPVPPHDGAELNDDELALLFACCDPALPAATQVAFALKLVCGFSLREIAAGLLSDEAALAQRLARARRTLAARAAPIAMPAGEQLPPRREAAFNAIHLLFNEGFAASGGDAGQRPDLCREAIRLARSVAAHRATACPDAHALAALLLLHGARLPSRIDAGGDWLLLDAQDRGRWDPAMIAAGLAHLQRAQQATALSAWHLRAGIAAEHATAPSFAATRWNGIVALYDALLRMDSAPTTRLAHAVALAQAQGAAAALPQIEALLVHLPAPARAYGHAAHAQMLAQLGRIDEAVTAIDEAIARAPQAAAERLLRRKREEIRMRR